MAERFHIYLSGTRTPKNTIEGSTPCPDTAISFGVKQLSGYVGVALSAMPVLLFATELGPNSEVLLLARLEFRARRFRRDNELA